MTMKRAITLTGAICATLAVLAGVAWATIPAQLDVHARVTDDDGMTLVEQPVAVIFRIYDTPGGGTELWAETHNTTTSSTGIISVTLGETSDLSTIDFSVPLWIEMDVGGETHFPRRQLVSSPYTIMADDAVRLGGEAGADHVLYDDLDAAGTINSPTNPVDWTQLKNVPESIADGDDATSGEYSLDASDGNPAAAVYVNGDGVVAVQNVFNPTLKLKSTGGGSPSVWFYRAANGQYDYRLVNDSGTMHMDLSLDNGATWSLMQHFGHDGSLGLGQLAPVGTYMLDVGGDARLAGGLTIGENGVADGRLDLYPDGRLDLYRNGSASPTLSVHDSGDAGTLLEGYDGAGNITFDMGPDTSTGGGGGGELRVRRNAAGDQGFTVDGNTWGTAATSVKILGTDRGMLFETQQEGNSSVYLPANAISAPEVLDEVGAATEGVSYVGMVEFAYPDDGPLLQQTITAPADGYVLAIATCEVRHFYSDEYSFGAAATLGVSKTTPEILSNQHVTWSIPDGSGSGGYQHPVTVHSVFPVTAGPTTFYLVGNSSFSGIGWTNAQIRSAQLSLIYIPTAYGDIYVPVSETARGDDATDGERTSIAAVEMANERSESIAANHARSRRELAELRAEIERFKAQDE